MGAGGRAVETAAALCSGLRFAFPMGGGVPLAVRRDDWPDPTRGGARSGSADAPCLERCGAEPSSLGVVCGVWWAVGSASCIGVVAPRLHGGAPLAMVLRPRLAAAQLLPLPPTAQRQVPARCDWPAAAARSRHAQGCVPVRPADVQVARVVVKGVSRGPRRGGRKPTSQRPARAGRTGATEQGASFA